MMFRNGKRLGIHSFCCCHLSVFVLVWFFLQLYYCSVICMLSKRALSSDYITRKDESHFKYVVGVFSVF
jgi:hypothetical protein